ncbi:hypothetical protein [Kocuria rosea]|uniref:hypothetical protein n=1 Tax=Kocuria rosea TaxID=1275 RepID=UPI001110CFA6|nr:hypothetical protein [Kocuria rosea]QCY33608.1 hypothetical protein EQG70_12670 [Kocuria rosea]
MNHFERGPRTDASQAEYAGSAGDFAEGGSNGTTRAPKAQNPRLAKASTRNIFGRFAWLALARFCAAGLQALT